MPYPQYDREPAEGSTSVGGQTTTSAQDQQGKILALMQQSYSDQATIERLETELSDAKMRAEDESVGGQEELEASKAQTHNTVRAFLKLLYRQYLTHLSTQSAKPKPKGKASAWGKLVSTEDVPQASVEDFNSYVRGQGEDCCGVNLLSDEYIQEVFSEQQEATRKVRRAEERSREDTTPAASGSSSWAAVARGKR